MRISSIPRYLIQIVSVLTNILYIDETDKSRINQFILESDREGDKKWVQEKILKNNKG